STTTRSCTSPATTPGCMSCSTSRARRDGAGVDPIWLMPPPGLGAAAAALPSPDPAGDPAGRLTAVLAAGAAGAYAWALDGPEAGAPGGGCDRRRERWPRPAR